MSLLASRLKLMADLANDPERAKQELAKLDRLSEIAEGWIEDPVGELASVEEIEGAAKALATRAIINWVPFSETSCQLSNAMSCIYGEAISRAYLKGRKDTMAEMVLCGECPDETQ